MPNKKIVIFDFDGTIADSLPQIGLIYNRIAKEKGYGEITRENLDGLREKSGWEIIKELKVPIYAVAFVVRKIFSAMNGMIGSLKMVDGMKEVLLGLKADGCELGILTSNSEANVKKFLRGNDLEIFDHLHCGCGIFGKKTVLRKIEQDNGFVPEQIIYIGDEIRDIEAAKSCGVKSVAVAWGVYKKEIIAKANPDFLAEKPGDLLEVVAKLQ